MASRIILGFSLFASFESTALALTARPLHRPTVRLACCHAKRSSTLVAQLAPGWVAGMDTASGLTYYYNEHTGATTWDFNQVAAQSDALVFWRVVPSNGFYSDFTEYTMYNGEEQLFGRYDMANPNPYISRAQCLLRVADDMPSFCSATITSLGKPPTALRAPDGGWYEVRKGETYALADGQEFALDIRNPESASFTVHLQREAAPQQGDYQQHQLGQYQGGHEPEGYYSGQQRDAQQRHEQYGQYIQPPQYGEQQTYGQQQQSYYGQHDSY